MKIKVGDIFKNLLTEAEYTVTKIADEMVVLESKDSKSQLLAGFESLATKTLYQRQEKRRA